MFTCVQSCRVSGALILPRALPIRPDPIPLAAAMLGGLAAVAVVAGSAVEIDSGGEIPTRIANVHADAVTCEDKDFVASNTIADCTFVLHDVVL